MLLLITSLSAFGLVAFRNAPVFVFIDPLMPCLDTVIVDSEKETLDFFRVTPLPLPVGDNCRVGPGVEIDSGIMEEDEGATFLDLRAREGRFTAVESVISTSL